MVRYIRSNQTEELHRSVESPNVKDIWYEYFDGTYESVENICGILGISRGEIVEAYIPDGVTKIGGWAFRDCYLLTRIILPDSVTEIGYRAFIDCISLESITIPDNVISIGHLAFKGCPSLVIETNNPYVINYCEEYGINYKDKT